MGPRLSQRVRLSVIIAISSSFFVAEISGKQTHCNARPCLGMKTHSDRRFAVGFYTHSLALIADAFHYVNQPCSTFCASHLS